MSATESLEIERKYAAPGRTAVPDLSGIPGIARVRRRRAVELQAQYFDTDDLALLRERVTLRRRVGGADEGWHLKLPSGADRRELQVELTDELDVPEDLLLHVRAVTRGRPLLPVMALSTRRTVHELLDAHGDVLAEVCDDRVSTTPGIAGVEPQVWREWEVEVKTGKPDLLDGVEPLLLGAGAAQSDSPAKLAQALADRLQVPGAPPVPDEPPTVGDVLRAYFFDEVHRLRRHDPGARLHQNDAIHQMRVAARRLRSVLSSYRELLDPELVESLRAGLKELSGALGLPRDAEVVRSVLTTALDDQPPERVIGPVRERLARELGERYDAAHAEAMTYLTSARYDALLAELQTLAHTDLGAGADQPATAALMDYLNRDWRRLRRRVRAAEQLDGPEREAELHEVRKAAKRLRYGMDSVSVLGKRKRAKRIAKAATRITEGLGDHNDAVVAAGVLREIATGAHAAGEDTLTYGRIEAALEATTDSSHRGFRQAVRRLNGRRPSGWKKI